MDREMLGVLAFALNLGFFLLAQALFLDVQVVERGCGGVFVDGRRRRVLQCGLSCTA